jgi:hypothetical protein
MLKNTKFYVAVALMAQSVASVVAGILSAAKKRTISTIAFFAIGGVSGAAGAYLMAQCVEEENEFEEYCDGDCENCAEFEECEALEELEEAEDEEAEVEAEEVDFELDGGEAFSRIAEAKDID